MTSWKRSSTSADEFRYAKQRRSSGALWRWNSPVKIRSRSAWFIRSRFIRYRTGGFITGLRFPRMNYFAIHVGAERFGDNDAAILLLIVLDDRDPRAADGEAAAVQGVSELGLLAVAE